jgi:hypothetical protein
MNSITNAQLTIVHDQVKKLAKVKVTCRITFGAIEHALMKLAPGTMVQIKLPSSRGRWWYFWR